MGSINGKQNLTQSQTYIEKQIRLFQWRADSTYNSDIARVRFSSLNSLRQRQKLESLLAGKKHKKTYIQLGQIESLLRESEMKNLADQIVVFQDYIGDVTILIEKLTLEESLYVIETLLRGHETIFQKITKTVVGLDCCFLTEEGQVRVWFNSDFTSNDLCQKKMNSINKTSQHQFYSRVQASEVGTIRQILRIVQYLCINRSQYHDLVRELREFTEKDILHNFSFSSVRKFINGYIYRHRLTPYFSLGQAIKNLNKNRTASSVLSCCKSGSSVAQNVSNGDGVWRGRLASTGGNVSTGAHLELLSQIQQNCGRGQNSPSLTSYSSRNRLDSYTPETTDQKLYQKKLSTTDVSRVQQRHLQRKLSKSAIAFNKERKSEQSESSIKNSFTKEIGKSYREQQLRSIPSELRGSKQQMFAKTSKIYEERCKQIKPAHSHKVSISSDSSAIFGVSPTQSIYPAFNKQSCSIYPVQSNNCAQSQMIQAGLKTPLSLKVDRCPSLHFERKVNGLIINSDLQEYESIGSFASMQNSCYSDYDGLLKSMGHSAKLVHIPTNKMIPPLNKSANNGAFMGF